MQNGKHVLWTIIYFRTTLLGGKAVYSYLGVLPRGNGHLIRESGNGHLIREKGSISQEWTSFRVRAKFAGIIRPAGVTNSPNLDNTQAAFPKLPTIL
jgi:hypothetical protein